MLADSASKQAKLRERSLCMQVALMGGRGEFVVSPSEDGHAFVWDRASGTLVNLLLAEDGPLACATPHPDCAALATCGASRIVRVWEPEVIPSAL